jgi:hypothetical protein
VNRLYQFAFHLGQQWIIQNNTPPSLKKKVSFIVQFYSSSELLLLFIYFNLQMKEHIITNKS